MNDYQHGDWVRFYQGSKLVIGVVQYTNTALGMQYVSTDKGCVREDSILEARKRERQ